MPTDESLNYNEVFALRESDYPQQYGQLIHLLRQRGWETSRFEKALHIDWQTLQAQYETARFKILEEHTDEQALVGLFLRRFVPVKRGDGTETWQRPPLNVYRETPDNKLLLVKSKGASITLYTKKDGTFDSEKNVVPLLELMGITVREYEKDKKNIRLWEFGDAVDKIIAGLPQVSYTIKRDDNALILSSREFPEITNTFFLSTKNIPEMKSTEARTSEANRQIEGYREQREQYELHLYEFANKWKQATEKLGLVRSKDAGNGFKYYIPGIEAVCETIQLGTPVKSAIKKLTHLEEKTAQQNTRREHKMLMLLQKGFVLDELSTHDESGTHMLLEISHPDPNVHWETVRVPLIAEGLLSDEANRLISRADQTPIPVKHVEQASVRPVSPPANGHVERVRKPDLKRPNVAPGVRGPRWENNIAPTNSPSNHQANGTSLHCINSPKGIEPKLDKVDIIIDANILSLLTGIRSKNRTWLDILPLLTSLPNVHLVFPSHIADFGFAEAVSQGGDTRTTDWERIPIYPQFHKSFFQYAHRNGADNHHEAVNPYSRQYNLHVWESPRQTATYQEMLKTLAGLTSGSEAYNDMMQRLRHCHENRVEELAPTYSQSPESHHPIIVVTNDEKFAKRFNGGGTPTLKGTNACGRGISLCSGYDFIGALNAAFNGNLAAELNTHFGGNSRTAGYDAIITDYNVTHIHKAENRPIFPYIRGKNEDGHNEMLLEDVLRAGIAARKPGSQHFAPADGGPGVWRREHITSTGIHTPYGGVAQGATSRNM